ncbi:hypothetical protein NCLIV_014660 [Neospora caninum Liverpool]|uniref:Thioesterase domain-containing protein n=1 Tax=Neospora caninum (strain Liverpool) TaxID=572307 RepID=F0VCI3_NEOCL|nr:hypothetical protein NCLIV_014660 [Neospora caninum Liverpool]CBZ51672.1 hypothetical protein NCLIV_014660 [Neospora caninum Liverpool]CEL65626.1 TPA: hypothetical protein BN1204_014660 [Neospora caninum Liverpool]|eukprot:XP_003881705.1 hypothetical protein NCLIV_014660 [Neospora caninum Liverpool]
MEGASLGEKEEKHVLVDGAPLLSQSAIPAWAHFCFKCRVYRTVPAGGVLDSAKAATRKTLWDAGETGRSSRGLSNRSDEEQKTAQEEEEEYAHLLHDVLTAYGEVSDLNYLVSCEDSVHTPEAAQTPQPAGAPSGVHTPGPSTDCASSESFSPEKKARAGASAEHTLVDAHMLVSCHVGRKVCGHKGVAHGGFIATLLDNSLGYMAHFVFKRAATKNLEVTFLRPLLVDASIVVDVGISSHDPEKGVCTVVGTVYALTPPQLRHLGKPGGNSAGSRKKGEATAADQAEKRTQPISSGGTAVPDGVWVVATGKAIMVDVTQKWKGIE